MTLFQLNPLDDKWKNVIVSEGTLRPKDLITTFFNFLRGTHPTYAQSFYEMRGTHPTYAQSFYETWEDIFNGDWDNADPDDVNQILTELFDVLDTIAPIGCSFESVEDDGACFAYVYQIEED